MLDHLLTRIGMGNRFLMLDQYHTLIRGHGVVAALTFLLIVPSAIMIARFYNRSPKWALRLHIWLQIMTVGLTTVVFVLGYFAVGPERSWTNPHHSIGLAIFVLVLAQAVGGWFVHAREKGRRRMYLPLKLMVSVTSALWRLLDFAYVFQFHQWLGRGIALLGLAQIPLGLTLYGSPEALFVLYALAAAILVVTYFILTYRRGQRIGDGYDSQNSERSMDSDEKEGRRRNGGLSRIARDAVIGAGLGTILRSRSRDHSRHRNRSRAEVVGSRRQSGSNWEDEKYSQYGRDPGRDRGKWTKRVLEVGAVAGAVALARKYLGGGGDRQRDHEERRYNPPHGRAESVSEDSLAQLEEGRLPPPSRQHPLNQPLNPPLGHRRSHSSFSQESYGSDDGVRVGGRRRHDGLATLGAAGLLRNIFKNRRERKEQRRLEGIRRQEMEEERIARMNSQGRYTGDGFPPGRGGRRGSLTTSTNFTGSMDNRPRPGPGLPPPIPAGVIPVAVAGGVAPLPPPPPPSTGVQRGNTILGANNPVLTGAVDQPIEMPPAPLDPQGILHQETSGSEIYYSSGGRPHRRHHPGRDGLVVGAATGVAAAEASRRQNRNSTGETSVASPPVSVKVEVFNNGRNVKLRRLTEAEVAEREARRRERPGKQHRRGSASSLGDTDGSERWRRTEAIERQQAEAMRSQNEVTPEHRPEGLVPPPPPIPSSSISPPSASVGSPGTYDGTGTEASADYANNRKRRRAERAQAKLARQEHRVGFE